MCNKDIIKKRTLIYFTIFEVLSVRWLFTHKLLTDPCSSPPGYIIMALSVCPKSTSAMYHVLAKIIFCYNVFYENKNEFVHRVEMLNITTSSPYLDLQYTPISLLQTQRCRSWLQCLHFNSRFLSLGTNAI